MEPDSDQVAIHGAQKKRELHQAISYSPWRNFPGFRTTDFEC